VQNGSYLISSSKDSQIRFWSILNKCCFYLLAESQSEIYSFALLNNENLLVIANAEIELLVFELKWNKDIKEECDNNDFDEEDDLNAKRIRFENINNDDKLLLKEDVQANVS
jgi:WD40 repeat protein